MDKGIDITELKQKVNKLIAECNYGSAINCLLEAEKEYPDNEEIKTLLKQLKKILEFQNRDIFGDANTDMDPWFE
ncbi:MAG: hypothetical protein U9N72_02080 [Bacteroidota bacterium]|nr:hypothetical protein [Bacteroidota bacterium]